MESLSNRFLTWNSCRQGPHIQLSMAISPWGQSTRARLPGEQSSSNAACISYLLAHNITELWKRYLLELQSRSKAQTGKDWALPAFYGWHHSVTCSPNNEGFLLAFSQKPFLVPSWSLAGDCPQVLAMWATHIASSKPARERDFQQSWHSQAHLKHHGSNIPSPLPPSISWTDVTGPDHIQERRDLQKGTSTRKKG